MKKCDMCGDEVGQTEHAHNDLETGTWGHGNSRRCMTALKARQDVMVNLLGDIHRLLKDMNTQITVNSANSKIYEKDINRLREQVKKLEQPAKKTTQSKKKTASKTA